MTDLKLIRAKYLLTDARLREEGLMADGAVCVEDSLIREVGPWASLRAEYPNAPVYGSDHHLALPGFIDAHNHGEGVTAFSKGILDQRLEIRSKSGPRFVNPPRDLPYWDTLVAAARQLRSGVTTSMRKRKDLPSSPVGLYRESAEHVIRAYSDAGLRLVFALGTTDLSSRLVYEDDGKFIASLPPHIREIAESLVAPQPRIAVDECLSLVEEFCWRYRNRLDVRFLIAITGSQWISDEILLKHRDKARSLGIGMHAPLVETIYQKMYAEREFGQTAVAHLNQLGILGPDFSCAHAVWVTESDVDLLASSGATVVHCPSSNLRFHGGIAPVGLMRRNGVNVALAVDTEGINDDDDTLQEMRLASLLHRVPRAVFEPLSEWDLIAMATINAAKPLGLDSYLGTLEAGKQADVITVDTDRIFGDYLHPSVSPMAALVYRGSPRDIDHVFVGGRLVYQHGRYAFFDWEEARRILNQMMQAADWESGEREYEKRERLKPYVQAYYDKWLPGSTEPIYQYNSKS
jgi:5-methylthioadenosine/S-adenosylhomocysteine deaminase